MNWKYFDPKFEYEEMFQDAGWPWAGHKFFAYDLVTNLKPKKIVELGTHYGTSFWSFSQAVKDNNLDTELNAVDTWKGDKHSKFYGEEVFETVKQIKDKFYSNLKIKLIRKTFDNALAEFEDKSIDILHIDGLHTYEAVKNDFENWLPKVKDNGIVLFHDIKVGELDFGVYRLWEELKKQYPMMEFHHSFGLGVLFKDKNAKNEILDKQKELQRHYYYLYESIKNEKLNASFNVIQQKDQEIIKLSQSIQQKDQEIIKLSQSIQQKDQEIIKLNKIVWRLNRKIFNANGIICRIPHKLIRHLLGMAVKVYKERGLLSLIRRTISYLKEQNLIQQKKQETEFIEFSQKSDYEKWIEKNEKWDKEKIKKEIKDFKYKPKISIITPVYNVDSKWLDKCIESVKNQFYENWELCLHDDASTKKEVVKRLRKLEKSDSRIKISYGKENQHISGASNEALKLTTGEFITLLDNDDELSPDALYENVKLLNKYPEADFIYSDEDKITEDGKREDPFFKPDWSPDLFLSMNYISHLVVCRKSIINKIGNFRKGYEGSQDYDLILRLVERIKPEKIFHIPKILYHWRKIKGSVAYSADAKNYAYVAAKKALTDYLKRNNIRGKVEYGYFKGGYRIKREIIKPESKVSIIIPFKDQIEILRKCIDGIFKKTDYNNFEIILVNNQSKEEKTIDYLQKIKNNKKITILNYDKPFNFSAINNFAVKKAKGEYVLFLNNDTEVINKEWLSAMVEHIQRKEIGAVGAKLLYPNNTIQHAGVVMGLGDVAGHAFRHFPKNEAGYFGFLFTIRNYSAVTGACLLTKKSVFNEVGGFDESNLPVAYNDVDLCLKIREKGYLIVYTPYSILYHYESLSRGNDDELKFTNPEKYKRVVAERDYMQNKWKKYIENDPYYNPNLTRDKEDFSLQIN